MQDEEKTANVQTVPVAVVNADDEKLRALGYGRREFFTIFAAY